MQVFLAVVRREFADATVSALGRRITLTHLIIAMAAVLLGWPVSYTIGDARWAPALAWWIYAELLTLSYLAIAVPADALENDQEIRPGDWISYGQANPLLVQAGQSIAVWLAMGFWLLTALPAFLLSVALTPADPHRLLTLFGFSMLYLGALTQIGTWIGVTIDSRPYRVIMVDITFAAVMVGSLFIQTWPGKPAANGILAHPLEIAARILNISAKEAWYGSAAGTIAGLSMPVSTTSAALPTIPWLSILTIYGSIFLVAAALTVVVLRQWLQRRQN